jgi:hypothetical protein
MGASLELDCTVGIGGVGPSVLVWEPDIAWETNINTRNDGVRCSILSTAASTTKTQTDQNFSHEGRVDDS